MADIKSTSSAAWWIKHPKKYQHRTTLCQDMTDLFRNISMHGYNKLLDAELFLYEKLLWFCIHVVNLVIVIILLSYTWNEFVSQHFALHLHDPLYPIENIPFPSVSICSNNRISRQIAKQYAKKLSLQDPANRSEAEFFQKIHYFNSLYYTYQRDHDIDAYDMFQTFLDNYDTNENERYFDIKKTLKMLTPNCTDYILKCFLNGKVIDCFGKDAFENGFTMYGPCCIFNYNNSYMKRNRTFRLKTPELGLTVLINSSRSDDVVSLLNVDAYIVLIHSPDDFPEVGTGITIEVFPRNNMESLIGVTANFIATSPQLRTFSASYRKCYFQDEIDDPALLFHQKYTFSNCILKCRIRSISALCNCVPFFVKDNFREQIGFPYCSLHHINCLQRYDFKWRNVLTTRPEILGLEREREEGLYCDQCLPSCDDTQYDISMMSLPTDRLVIPDNIGNDLDLRVEEISVLRVYFAEATASYYKREVSNEWEEAFSTVGNILSIFLGFSMVAVFEMMYFVIKYLHLAFKAFIANSKENSKLHKKAVKIKKKELFILP